MTPYSSNHYIKYIEHQNGIIVSTIINKWSNEEIPASCTDSNRPTYKDINFLKIGVAICGMWILFLLENK